MPNPLRGVVDVELDGTTHQLKYNLNAFAELEEVLELGSIQEIAALVTANLSMRTLRALLWAGLLHNNSKLTEQEVGEMDFQVGHVAERVSQALALAFKRDGAPPEGNARRPGRGTGPKRKP